MAEAKKPKKVVEPKAAPVADEPEVIKTREDQHSSWNISGIFWGLLLIVVGGLFLLSNFGVVNLDWTNIWRIWPIAIIVAGLSVMSLRSTAWKILTGLLMIMALAAVVLLATGAIGAPEGNSQTYNSSVQKTSGNITDADVTVNAGASSVKVITMPLDVTAKATLSSNITKLKQDTSIRGNTQYVTFSGESTQGMWFGGNFKNDWNVILNESLPSKLTIDAGASQIDADVSHAKVTELTLKAGASSSVITIGDILSRVKVSINSGASTVVLRVPSSSGISLKLDGGLMAKNMMGMNQLNDQNYQSDNYDSASNKIDVTADMGAANFTLERF